jgi:hypothetical protein
MFFLFDKFSFAWFLPLLLVLSSNNLAQEPEAKGSNSSSESTNRWKYRNTQVLGWTVRIREEIDTDSPEAMTEAIEQLKEQLEEIEKVVPPEAVAKLKGVVLWFSPEYEKGQPRAEYHPGREWLVNNGRDPAMVRGVEFTNVRVFAAERKRMPNFVLHELAHAYHHQFLTDGFENKRIAELYQRAKDAGIYEQVEQRFGDGRSEVVKAYGMNNPAEYFAENSEAYFSTNDFFPFEREQLLKHDPAMLEALKNLWGN